MHCLQPPKVMKWSKQLDQKYITNRSILITSGCSFTASTLTTECAASWPGFVRDRCGFDFAVDMSYPGVGNQYIADSVIWAIENYVDNSDRGNIAVIVMWSGLNRMHKITSVPDSDQQSPRLGQKFYVREKAELEAQCRDTTTELSFRSILQLRDYLLDRSIPYAFCQYANLLFPPFLPKRDTTHHFQDYLDTVSIKLLQKISWIPANANDYLYEWSLINDYLNGGDRFHPPVDANLKWTDEILLPALAQLWNCQKMHITK